MRPLRRREMKTDGYSPLPRAQQYPDSFMPKNACAFPLLLPVEDIPLK
jgi:hypothetical protein